MRHLGYIFEYGDSRSPKVKIDLPKAVRWYKEAADKGDDNALKALTRLNRVN